MTASDGDQSADYGQLDQSAAEEGTQLPAAAATVSRARPTSKSGSTSSVLNRTLQIKLDKRPLLESMREKVEKKYCVKICFDLCSASDGKSAPDTQWICISGSKGDCKDAAAYIGALCNPAEWTVYEYEPAVGQLFNEEGCQMIENKSHAVLIRDGSQRLIIQGSDQLRVMLALSLVEDIVSRYRTNVTNVRKSSTSKSSAVFDNMLQRAYSGDSEAGDGCDWSTMPEEVKQSVLVSLLDDEDVTETTVVDVESVPDEATEGLGAIVTAANERNSSVPVAEAINDVLPVVIADTVPASNPSLDISDPAIQPLVKLAVVKGYSEEEIVAVLKKTSEWKESEFLRALHTNRRLQTVTCQHQPDLATNVIQRSVVSCPSFATSTQCSPTVDRSRVCTVIDSGNGRLHELRSRHATVADVEVAGRSVKDDSCMEVDEQNVNAADDDSVILLRSDHETESSADEEKMDVENDVVSKVKTLPYQHQPANNVAGNEPVRKNTTAELGLATGQKQKKKKRKKKKPSCDVTASRKDNSSQVKIGKDMNELDCISLIPSSSSSAVDIVDDDVIVVGEDDSIIELSPESANAESIKVVVSQNALENKSSQSPPIKTSSTCNSRCDNEGLQHAPQLTPLLTNVVPPAASGITKSSTQAVSEPGSLRYIVIDGSNVAMSHGNGKIFSCRGIKLVIDFFKQRGHSKVVALVPQWRRQAPRFDYPVSDHQMLEKLKDEGSLTFTPSRRIGNRNISCYDDRFMVDLAIQTEGVIVTNDNYRDLYEEKFQYRTVIENRLLPYSFVGDIFMIPEDPLGQYGPHLDEFLQVPSSRNETGVSSGISRTSALDSNLQRQTVSSSFGPWHNNPHGVSHRQTAPSGTGLLGQYPGPQPVRHFYPEQLPEHGQLQWRSRQRFVQMPQRPSPSSALALWPPPQRAAMAVRSKYQTDSASAANAENRGRSGQSVAPRQAGPQLNRRPPEKTRLIRDKLLGVFPNNVKEVDTVLQANLCIYSVDELCLKVAEIV